MYFGKVIFPLLIFSFLVSPACTTHLIKISTKNDVEAYKGEGRFLFHNDNEESGNFIFVITKEGNVRADLVTFWGQPYAMISVYQGRTVLFSLFENIVYEVDESRFLPLSAIFGVVGWILFNRKARNRKIFVKKEGDRYIFKVKRFLEGKAFFGENLNMFFKFKNGGGEGEIVVTKIEPCQKPSSDFFKLPIPPDVKIEKLE